MNSSLFSSFDAVCAEFFGHKVRASMPCATAPRSPKPQEENMINSCTPPKHISTAATRANTTERPISLAKPTNAKVAGFAHEFM